MSFWSLPGPSLYLEDVEEAIREGTSVVTRFPGGVPEGFERAMKERLQKVLGWRSLDASDAGEDILGFLYGELCPSTSAAYLPSISGFAAQPELRGLVMWIDGVPAAEQPRWAAFVRAYSDASRAIETFDRAVFALVLSGPQASDSVPDEAAFVTRDFRSSVDPIDLFILAMQDLVRRSMPREHKALHAQAVASLAQWDWRLATVLIDARLEDVLKPEPLLERFAAERGWCAETPRLWQDGTADGPAGSPVPHSAVLLASGDVRGVRHRLWSAQAAVLLPLIEERRVELIAAHARGIRFPVTLDGREIGDPLDLSIGQLAWHLDEVGCPAAVRKNVYRLRRMRNALAHMEPVEGSDALHRQLLPAPVS